ncbi:hypothetical protein [Planosporangium mesophilum]|uniref:hypothetical protein n=1 Tax=Planosporangium mesophilum TaxID=689768 RepID=UPI00194F7E03|nr:hypothetical protein [Planosporangium mesophilum]
MNDPQERRPVGRKTEQTLDERGLYGPGYLDEITEPQDEARQAREAADRQDVADHPLDPQIYRDGGPQETPGMVTTTGGHAGKSSAHPYHDRQPKGPGKVANPTTGDATSGGMGTPVGGSTSDATTGGSVGGTIVGGCDQEPDGAPAEGAGADRTGGGEYGG